MEVLLPNLKGKDENTLYFIGNGFDLFHEVKTKYIHFYSWLNLKDKEHEQFAAEMESFFQSHGIHGNHLWQDFEEALGDIDINKIQEQYSGLEENAFFDENYQQRAAQRLHKTIVKIPLYLKEWIADTNISNVKPMLPLSKSSLYLSFNYTMLLERIYNIPTEQIVHIHHCCEDLDDLVTGHNKEFPKWPDYPSNINIEKALQYLSGEANALKKPVRNIIKQHSGFFSSLSRISNIVVFGHSLSPVDKPYFEKVLYNVQDDAKWHFVVFDGKAKERYEAVVKSYIDYINDPQMYGVSQYKEKIKYENCEYIGIKESNFSTQL